MVCAVRNSKNFDERTSEEWPQSVVHEPSSQHMMQILPKSHKAKGKRGWRG
jgi:hypothetical protein